MALNGPDQHRDDDYVHEPVRQLTVEQDSVDLWAPDVHEHAQDDGQPCRPHERRPQHPRGFLTLPAGQQLRDGAHEGRVRAEIAQRVDDARERDADRPHGKLIGREVPREPRREPQTHKPANDLPCEQIAGIPHNTSTTGETHTSPSCTSSAPMHPVSEAQLHQFPGEGGDRSRAQREAPEHPPVGVQPVDAPLRRERRLQPQLIEQARDLL